jgi:hypothetical protein
MSVYPSRRLRSTRAEIGDDTSIAAYADIRAVEKTSQADHVAFGRVDAPDGFQIMAYDVQPWKAYNPGENRSRSRYRRPKAMRSSPYGMLGPRCSRRPLLCRVSGEVLPCESALHQQSQHIRINHRPDCFHRIQGKGRSGPLISVKHPAGSPA